MNVKVSTLKNGLRVISDPMPGLETAAVGVWVDTGARHETAEENGISHVLEHMAFKGTGRRSALQIAELIESVGGHLNAYTSRDQTAYFARVLKDDLPLAVDILGDILLHSSFDQTEIAREKEVIVQEIGQTYDTPDDIIFDHLQEASFPDQPIGRSILGTVGKVRGFDRSMIAGYMKSHYLAPKMVLSASGAVDHDRLVTLAEKAFDGLAAKGDTGMEPAHYSGGEFREERELEQVHYALSVPGISYTDDDYYTAQVLSGLLGGGMSSRLFQEIREKRGLCYSVFSFSSSFADTGTFSVYAGTGEEHIKELSHMLTDELLRASDGIQQAEVERAKAQLKASLLMGMESPASRSEVHARQILIYGRVLPTSEIAESIDAVTVEATQNLAGKLFFGVTPSIAALGPLKNLESFDQITARFR
ncbi:M16 family metallopeptidase [Sneathiella sp. HT1-7]|jgi:predicted Zn-dependent peptidase|uniref:M16 family metallopeptidase n=1 Tax=Sneathiella sp. HT1-7 TaxID=2887192 RepID=UPI001D13BAD3|nr:pitrilysin family protein [Sneathiella sp. HT1-7]MCC3303415.1 insulinase family protein [Sneathiella sp. HT1-7]